MNSLFLAKIYCVDSKLLKTIYFAIFESHHQYGCQLLGADPAQTQVMNNIEKIQNKALQKITLKAHGNHMSNKQKFTKIISYLFYTEGGSNTDTIYERKFECTTSENNNLWFQLSHTLRD